MPSRSTRVAGGASAAPSSPSVRRPFGSSSSPPAGRPARRGPNGDGVSAASVIRYGRQPLGNDRSKTCESYTGSKLRTERNARCRPSAVNAGEVSTNRCGVASETVRVARLASTIWRSDHAPRVGCDQASQAESGLNASPLTSPSVLCASSCTAPSAKPTSSTRPSCAPTASCLPSGETSSERTRPSCPVASRRRSVPSTAGAYSIASSPSASVTQTTPCAASSPAGPGTTRASRPRTPGVSSSTRAGPSRWVSQCTEPRTTTAPARPVRSGAVLSSQCAADTGRGRRPVRGPAGRTSRRRDSAPSRSSSSHRSPALCQTTRLPSVVAVRA